MKPQHGDWPEMGERGAAVRRSGGQKDHRDRSAAALSRAGGYTDGDGRRFSGVHGVVGGEQQWARPGDARSITLESDRSPGLRSGNTPGWENLAIGGLPMRGGRPVVAGWTIMVDTERRGSRIKWRPRAVRAWRRIERAMVQNSPAQESTVRCRKTRSASSNQLHDGCSLSIKIPRLSCPSMPQCRITIHQRTIQGLTD
ncbi:hypothetical protein PVAR5_6332 [Paecilomyces variotii No. 5]|uniref:Uncharacterized protein n=1 Tax=Byssochlamys spectabilis (strain No. 5 / NBRC 109023) TaxID=1356009 RepID=V5G9S0_BYSSN|nr:hypothetical protein PVAR5_6332 [Paecilomyces variotii No. 5]